MGWGDEIMVTAQARRMQAADRLGRRVAVRGRYGEERWSAIWEGNPRMARPGSFSGPRQVLWLRNYPGARPYLDYAQFKNSDRTQAYVYTNFSVEPGEIYLSAEEELQRSLLAGAIVLEPTIKPKASPNKDWGWQRWVELAGILRRSSGRRLVQLGQGYGPTLPGVDGIVTPTFRQACALLAGADLLIAPEGGLHHAAAALGVRAVVIFGGFISPATTGYAMHRNLFTGVQACGMRIGCAHCADAMAKIRPAEVAAAALEQLDQRQEVAA